MSGLMGVDPRTGIAIGPGVLATTGAELQSMLESASAAQLECASASLAARQGWLAAISVALSSKRDEIVESADRHTALGHPRLTAELDRTLSQLQLFVDVLAEGSFLEVVIDDLAQEAMPGPPRQLRRLLRPVGPVGVWAASNFPLAFGVIGTDTASALAAGCPVIVKAHPSQPGLSAQIAAIVADALIEAGAPRGTFSLIHGMPAARALIADERIRAASFTGSHQAGRALFDEACRRTDPIPFFAEMGSINPVFVTPAAARERASEIGRGLVASATLGVGQFCTKPGLIFVPKGSQIASQVSLLMPAVPPGAMLNRSMQASFMREVESRRYLADVVHAQGSEVLPAAGSWVAPSALVLSAEAFADHADLLMQECFGPFTVVVEVGEPEEMLHFARSLPGMLTATIHGEQSEDEDSRLCAQLLEILSERAGRLIWNGWPTGVAVTWSMHHGGPYPATTAASATSVGASAIRRFLRPVAYQGFPQELLPANLRDDELLGVVRRNGQATLH